MELLKRNIDKYLLDWKNNPERKPLIVKGALCVVIKGLRNVNDVWRASIFPPFDI